MTTSFSGPMLRIMMALFVFACACSAKRLLPTSNLAPAFQAPRAAGASAMTSRSAPSAIMAKAKDSEAFIDALDPVSGTWDTLKFLSTESEDQDLESTAGFLRQGRIKHGRRNTLSSMAAIAAFSLTSTLNEPLPAHATELTGAGAERFARAMSSEGAKVYERRVAVQKKELFKSLDDSCANVLEIGIGSGPNMEYYGSGVKKLTGVDPNPFMLEKVAGKHTAGGVVPSIVNSKGEQLPFADASFDAVVSTLVLCSVENPNQVLREIARVLKPGGRYLFMEHVRGTGLLANAQDLYDPLQVQMAAGCHLNRRSGSIILGAPEFARFSTVQEFSAMGDKGEQFLISPHIMGVAWKSAEAAGVPATATAVANP